MTGGWTGGPSSVHKLPLASIVVASSLRLFFCYPCIKRASYINNAQAPRPFPPFSALQFQVCRGLKCYLSEFWNPTVTLLGPVLFLSGSLRASPRPLGDIVKSRRPRDTCVARLTSIAQIGELGRRLFIRRMVILGFAALQIQKFFAYKDSSGELEQPCRVSSFYTGFELISCILQLYGCRFPPFLSQFLCWKKTNKGNYHLNLCMPFVCLVSVRCLLSSVAVLYYVNG